MKLLLICLGLGALLIGFIACKATRAGYESASYRPVRTVGKFEIRDYPALMVASTTSAQGRDDDGRFMKLFRYISGENEKKEKIAMTTPVFMTGNDRQNMSFVVPEKTAQKGAPKASSSEVRIEKLPAARYAAFRYNGAGSRENEESALAKLRAWTQEQGLTVTGPAMVAYYDPPFTPPSLRRNEVMLPIAK